MYMHVVLVTAGLSRTRRQTAVLCFQADNVLTPAILLVNENN